VEGQSLLQKDQKRRIKKGEKNFKKNWNSLKTYFDFCVCCSKDALNPGVSGRKACYM